MTLTLTLRLGWSDEKQNLRYLMMMVTELGFKFFSRRNSRYVDVLILKNLLLPNQAIRNKCPVKICFSTRWKTSSLSLEWHHFLFDTSSPMRHSWWVLFACTQDICLFSLFSKRICAKEKAESLKITFLPKTEFISNSRKKRINFLQLF